MVNSQVVKEVIDGFKLDLNSDKIPPIIPVIDVNLKHNKNIDIIRTGECFDATSAIIYATPTSGDFYLKSVVVSSIRDSTATALFYGVTAVINGVTVFIVKVPQRATNAITPPSVCQISFDNPIKIDKNSNINVVSDTNVALIKVTATIHGYIDEIS